MFSILSCIARRANVNNLRPPTPPKIPDKPFIIIVRKTIRMNPTSISDVCSINNGGCEDICTAVRDGRVCKCQFGFTLEADGTSCRSGEHCCWTNQLSAPCIVKYISIEIQFLNRC